MMKQYQEMLEYILENGKQKRDRTGTGTISAFGYQNRYDLREGFPLVTTKDTRFDLIVKELLWFISGSTNVRDLVMEDVNIWNKDAYRGYREFMAANYPEENILMPKEFKQRIKEDLHFAVEYGELGPIYGQQWRSWPKQDGTFIDQIGEVIQQLKDNPDSRRLLVFAYNPGMVEDAVLPPCHIFFQLYVEEGKFLCCQMYQRSADAFLGVPFNIASYALLTKAIAQVSDLIAKDFVHTFGDLHIYNNHIDQVRLQLTRAPKTLPKVHLNPEIKNIDAFTFDDFVLNGYDPYPPIKGEMSS